MHTETYKMRKYTRCNLVIMMLFETIVRITSYIIIILIVLIHDENISELHGSTAHLIIYKCKLPSTGETGIGKSTLINTLFNTTFESDEASHYLQDVHLRPKTYDLQESNVNLKLTIVDTVGFGDQINKDERYCLLFVFFFFVFICKLLNA